MRIGAALEALDLTLSEAATLDRRNRLLAYAVGPGTDRIASRQSPRPAA